MGFCLIIGGIILIIMFLASYYFSHDFIKAIVACVIAAVFMCIIDGIIITTDMAGQTACQEVWSGKVDQVKHQEEWDEHIKEQGHWEEEKDEKGHVISRNYVIDVPDHWEHHEATNSIHTSDEGWKDVDCSTDYKIKFSDSIVNSDVELQKYYPIGMPTASIHIYENRIQASNSIYKKNDVDETKYKNLPKYPKAKFQYSIPRIIGNIPNKQECVNLLNKYNSELNDTNNKNNKSGKKSYKQINMIFVNMGNVSQDYGYALENYWKGGNKNDLIIAFGSKNNKVTWCNVITWSESAGLKRDISFYMKDECNLNDFKTTITNVADMAEKQFVRKQFADFNYIQIYTSAGAKIAIIIFSIIASAIVFIGVENYDKMN